VKLVGCVRCPLSVCFRLSGRGKANSARAVGSPKSAHALLSRWQSRTVTMASLLFASFTNFTQLLFVQPPIIDEYEGLEYSWKIFVFRPARESPRPCMHRARKLTIHNTVFKYEAFFFAAVIIYGMFFWFGSESNRTRANSWCVASHFIRGFRAMPC
jgi:hypothetical protein